MQYLEAKLKAMNVHRTHAHANKTDSHMTNYNAVGEPSMEQEGCVVPEATV